MITTEQMAAAHTFLVACEPANALVKRPATQNRRAHQDQLHAAQAGRHEARVALQDLCGSRAVYQEAIAAARDKRKLG